MLKERTLYVVYRIKLQQNSDAQIEENQQHDNEELGEIVEIVDCQRTTDIDDEADNDLRKLLIVVVSILFAISLIAICAFGFAFKNERLLEHAFDSTKYLVSFIVVGTFGSKAIDYAKKKYKKFLSRDP